MPKGRHLKPEFFTDKHVVGMTPLARLLYQGLWCYAADCGHLDDEPVELKMRILPADNCNVEDLLDELVQHDRIERKDGVIFLPKLLDHARVDKRYETACDACKARRDHDGKPSSKPTDHDVTTKGTRSDHDVTTRADPPNHAGDGDGDGDGDGGVRAASGGTKRATQLPKDFAPNEANARLAAERGVDLSAAVAKFTDYHLSKGSVFKDWHRALSTWLRNEKPSPHLIVLQPDPDDPADLPPVEQSWMRRRPNRG